MTSNLQFKFETKKKKTEGKDQCLLIINQQSEWLSR